jgi:group II intron reverse transcriptase/maturase
MDKLVQEAIRLILDAIYEPAFLDTSHGFRPNRSCHTALKAISQSFSAATWAIEGGISKCFDSIDHHKLMLLIEAKIADRRFTRLVWKSLRAGYMEFTQYRHNIVGIPQGSVISPILANVFLHELDKFAATLKTDFDRGTKARRTHISRSLEFHIAKAKAQGNMEQARKLASQRASTPAIDYRGAVSRRLSYVRFADDWIIGIRGTRQEAEGILKRVSEFCNQLGLKVSESKTKITNLNSDRALFLGTFISRSRHTKYQRKRWARMDDRDPKPLRGCWDHNYRHVIQHGPLKLRFEAPLDHIKRELTDAGFIKANKSHPRFLWLHHNHDQILHLYNAVLRGYLNYYSFAHNYPQMVSLIHYYLKQSCAKLLTAKFNLRSMKKTYDKFGNLLESPNKAKFLKPSYKASLKFSAKANPIVTALYGSKSIAPLEGLNCSVCGSSNHVEMHYVRALKDLDPKLSHIDQLMVKAHRKQIPLCRSGPQSTKV